MIIVFKGARGSGKTLSMVRKLKGKYEKKHSIYANLHLKFRYNPITMNDLKNYAKSREKFNKSVFAIDEIGVWADARNNGSKGNKFFSYFVAQTRKKDVDIYCTTQFARLVEVRLRLNTDMVVECSSISLVWKSKNSKPVWKKNYMKKEEDYMVHTWIQNKITEFDDSGDRVTHERFYANPYYPLYDTTEIIEVPNDDED